jgi:hypothetical protein
LFLAKTGPASSFVGVRNVRRKKNKGDRRVPSLSLGGVALLRGKERSRQQENKDPPAWGANGGQKKNGRQTVRRPVRATCHLIRLVVILLAQVVQGTSLARGGLPGWTVLLM